jgi:hypothetical protein
MNWWHRHQLHRRNSEPLQVLDNSRLRQGGVAPAQILGHVGMQPCQPRDVRLVDQRVRVRRAWRPVARPVEERVDHDGGRDVLRRVVIVCAARVAPAGAVDRLVPLEPPRDRLGIRVEQQLLRVAAQPAARVIRAVHAIAVSLPRYDGGQVRMPNIAVNLPKRDACLRTVVVDQAQFDALADARVQRKVGAPSVKGRAQRIRGAGIHAKARRVRRDPHAEGAYRCAPLAPGRLLERRLTARQSPRCRRGRLRWPQRGRLKVAPPPNGCWDRVGGPRRADGPARSGSWRTRLRRTRTPRHAPQGTPAEFPW